MRYKKIFIIALLLLLSSNMVFAQSDCSSSGYTILSINGIFTDLNGAKTNAYALKRKLPPTYNNEKVNVDYIYNPTHLAGLGDLIDVVKQGLFDQKSDYDLEEMLQDASSKVNTQKVLLVGHSQGNFYANNFYDKVANQPGGIPSESIGVYGVATPADRVASNGKYLTSDTDNVIAAVVARVKKIMPPNTHIVLQKSDGYGHGFSDVYLKYRGDKIVSDIESSLGKLKTNQIQNTQSLCIAPQKLSLVHKVAGAVLGAADFVVNVGVKTTSLALNTITGITKSIASTITAVTQKSLAAVGLYNSSNIQASANQIIKPNIVQNVVVADNIDNADTANQTTTDSPGENINSDDSNNSSNTDSINNTEVNTPNVPIVLSGNSGGGGGNSNSSSSSISNVVIDTTPPVINIIGESSITIPINSNYVDAGATAVDNIDGEILVEKTGTVDTSTIGTYVITYTATDAAKNISTLTRTVNVVNKDNSILPDTVAPVITLRGQAEVTIPTNSTYTDQGVTATDNVDGEVDVITSGVVNSNIVGKYTITYTAKDKALNIATLTRTVNVVDNVVPSASPSQSQTSAISLPTSGTYAATGLDPVRGRKNLTQFLFQIIYTDSNNNAPKDIKLHVKNTTTSVSLPDAVMNKVSSGINLLSDGNYANGEAYTFSNTYDQGDYSYSFTADDKDGNFVKAIENNDLRFTVISSTYTYLPVYSFGVNNGDGNDWQVWPFNGSNVYDWTDTYVDNYLHEQFKIQTYPGGAWCSLCLQRGIFNHDPQKGFELSDMTTSNLESSPQNNMNGIIYNVVTQWDSTGYTYTIYHDSIIDASGRTDVPNINNNFWVGWDGSFNNFQTFPSGNWRGVISSSPMERTGGDNMMIRPYPIYSLGLNSIPPPIPTTPPVQNLSSEKIIKSFNFEELTPKVTGIINNNTVSLTVPYGTDIKSLVPTITESEKASIDPVNNLVQDFTNPVTYTVKAEDGTTQPYVVTVTISPNPNPEPNPIITNNDPPTIISNTLNGVSGNVSVNPLINNLTIVLTANKNVNWMSIKLEKEDDPTLYKMFLSGAGCVDGTSVCTKVWDGILSGGGLLQSGNYKIKAHIKDENGKEYNEYLSSVIDVVTQ